MDLRNLLNQVGLDSREAAVYLELLACGSCAPRHLAEAVGLDRARVALILKSLQRQGLVSLFNKHKKEFYQAENPERLLDAVERRERDLASSKRQLAELLPEIKQLYAQGGSRPAIRYFEGTKGSAIVLQEILHTVSQQPEKLYRVYSSDRVRQSLSKEFPKFTRERIDRKISVRVIGFGQYRHNPPLSEHRWLNSEPDTAAYIAVFGPKVAYFTVDQADGQPRAMVVENADLAAAERLIFDSLWGKLG